MWDTLWNPPADVRKSEFHRASFLLLSPSLSTCDADHNGIGDGGMAAQSKRKILEQQAIPTTHSNKQEEELQLGGQVFV